MTTFDSEENRELALNIATTIGKTAATTQLALALYDKFLGPSYSEKDYERLKELKLIYKECLGVKSPVAWELDDARCPTQRIEYQNWPRYIKQANENKPNGGNFYYQRNLIAQLAATYLIDRGSRRFGAGKSGDLLEQFMSEWIHFALNDLPSYEFNETSITKLKQRKKYIESIRKHPNLFHLGFSSRSRNKFETLNQISQQLQSCINTAIAEEANRCARDKLQVCLNDTTRLLLECTSILYYARGTDVHLQPINFEHYVGLDIEEANEEIKKVYAQLKTSHSGMMLYEVIRYAGLEAFGIHNKDETPLADGLYFNAKFQPKLITWSSKNTDMPAWINQDNVTKILQQQHSLAYRLIWIKEVRKLLGQAYQLSGDEGDKWAYSHHEGKKWLTEFLTAMEKQYDLLKLQCDEFYQSHNDERLKYNLTNRIEASADSNPNFNEVDDKYEIVLKLCASLKKTINEIRVQMAKYPNDAEQRNECKKQAFYTAIKNYWQQFPVENTLKYDADVKPLPVLTKTFELSQPVSVSNSLKFALKIHADCGEYLYLNLPQFKRFIYQNPTRDRVSENGKWHLGDKYNNWMKNFFVRHKAEFTKYQENADNLHVRLQSASLGVETQVLTNDLLESLRLIKQTIINERPQWRFKFGLWPIKTKGWPFNRDANEFANLMTAELESLQNNIQLEIKRAEERETKRAVENTKIIDTAIAQPSLTVISTTKLAADRVQERANILFARQMEIDKLHAELMSESNTPSPQSVLQGYSQFGLLKHNQPKLVAVVVDADDLRKNKGGMYVR